jgi:hypothetical protein
VRGASDTYGGELNNETAASSLSLRTDDGGNCMVFAKTPRRTHWHQDDSAVSGQGVTALSLVEVDPILSPPPEQKN